MALKFSTSNEREALAGFLDRQRDALVRKVRDVSDVDARRSPTASSMSLLGLLKHLAVWEVRWFQGVVAGNALPDGWPERKSPVPDEELFVDDSDAVEHWIGQYQDAAEASRQIVSARELDQVCARTDIIDCNLRLVMLHMIEETARHAGHADIIRETLDGSRGL